MIIGIGFCKSTISKVIYEELKNDKATVLLDGDQVRDIFSNDIGTLKKIDLKMLKIRNLVNYLIYKNKCCLFHFIYFREDRIGVEKPFNYKEII